MKKLLFYIIALPCLVLALDGCRKEEKVPDGGSSSPIISVRKPSAYSFLPGTYSLPYTIDNPREGVMLEVSTDDEWITGLTADKENISFTLSANNPSKERTGSISICYEGAEPVKIEIRQKKEDIVPLDKDGITANCYIVPEAGVYQFPMVKGNSTDPVGKVAAVEVLWETFGTDKAPEQGDLIQIVLHEDNMAYFKTGDNFRKGNAVIAARDAGGIILWSWHIWMTDKPQDQVYLNGAGTMMDRHLGATSATPGDAEALGLLYQWGRKDPFLGSSSGTEAVPAKSTAEWPVPVKSDATSGTIENSIAHPMTFITANSANYDWCYTGNESVDNDRWKSVKTVYDPCPPGYRVPDGGQEGIWAKACKTWESFFETAGEDSDYGYNFGSSGSFGNKLSEAEECWYPVTSGTLSREGELIYSLSNCKCWSCTTEEYSACALLITRVDEKIYIKPAILQDQGSGYSVRCMKE